MLVLVLLAIILLPIEPAHGVTCRAAPIKDGVYWQWRQIDGRRCWYPGRQQLAKVALHWGSETLMPTPPRPNRSVMANGRGGSRTPPPVADPINDDAPPPKLFAARWVDEAQPVRTVSYAPPARSTHAPATSKIMLIFAAWFAALLVAWSAHSLWLKYRGGLR